MKVGRRKQWRTDIGSVCEGRHSELDIHVFHSKERLTSVYAMQTTSENTIYNDSKRGS